MLARIARSSVRHRRLLAAAWAVLFVAGIVIGGGVFERLDPDVADPVTGDAPELVAGDAVAAGAAPRPADRGRGGGTAGRGGRAVPAGALPAARRQLSARRGRVP